MSERRLTELAAKTHKLPLAELLEEAAQAIALYKYAKMKARTSRNYENSVDMWYLTTTVYWQELLQRYSDGVIVDAPKDLWMQCHKRADEINHLGGTQENHP